MEKFIKLDKTNQISVSHFLTGKGDARVKVTKMWKPVDSEKFVYTKLGFSLDEESARKLKKALFNVIEDLANAESIEPRKSSSKSKSRNEDEDRPKKSKNTKSKNRDEEDD